jgi:hypothetical protein
VAIQISVKWRQAGSRITAESRDTTLGCSNRLIKQPS